MAAADAPPSQRSRKDNKEKGPDHENSSKDRKQKKHKAPKNAFDESGPLLAKAASFLLQNAREVESIILDVLLLDTDSQPVLGVKTATKDWSKKVEEAGKGHTHGPPHVSALEGCLGSILKLDIGGTNKAKMQDLISEISEIPLHQRPMYIRACRVRPAYDRSKTKLALALTGPLEKYRCTIIDSLIQGASASYKTGRAPPSAMERELQKLLDNWAQ